MILIELKTDEGIEVYASKASLEYFQERKEEKRKEGRTVDHITAKEVEEIFPFDTIFYL